MQKIKLIGTRTTNFELSHEFKGEKFYKCLVATERLSGNKDILPVIVPEIFTKEDYTRVEIDGQVRTRNVKDGDISHLNVYVFARDYREADGEDLNVFEGEGNLCKLPKLRVTPLGKEITDLLLAFNRDYDKSDYIPTLAWGRNAHRTADLEVGTKLKVKGRLQSRDYKKLIDDEWVDMTTYELSVSEVNANE